MKKHTVAFFIFYLIGSSSYQAQTVASLSSGSPETSLAQTTHEVTIPENGDTKEVEWIIFDVGGVILTPSKRRAFYHLGILETLKYVVRDRKNPAHLHRLLFDILDKAYPWEPNTPYVPHDKGTRLPRLLANDWFCSTRSNEEILTLTHAYLDQAFKDGQICSNRELRLLRNLARLILTPAIIADIVEMIPGTPELIRDLAAIQRTDGTPRYKLCVLSNYDGPAFACVQKKYADLFNQFNGRLVVSGFPDVQKRKPDPSIYEHLATTLGVNLATALMIDDELDNLNTAATFGIRTVHCKNCNIKQVRADLTQLGILPIEPSSDGCTTEQAARSVPATQGCTA